MEDPKAHQDKEVGVLGNLIKQKLDKENHSQGGKNCMKITWRKQSNKLKRKLETWDNRNNKA